MEIELDEIIKRCNDRAEELAELSCEEECREYALELWQVAEWLTELKRLQSMGSHCDGYESKGYVFSYYESGEFIRITIYNTKSPDHYYVDEVGIFKALSHDEFVEWCNDYLNKENK